MTDYEADRDLFEKSYYNTKSLLMKISSQPDLITLKQAADVKSQQLIMFQPPQEATVRLPQINIPGFSGDYQQ